MGGMQPGKQCSGALIVCCVTEGEVGVSEQAFEEQLHQVPHVPSPSQSGEQSQGVWVLQISSTQNWCLCGRLITSEQD